MCILYEETYTSILHFKITHTCIFFMTEVTNVQVSFITEVTNVHVSFMLEVTLVSFRKKVTDVSFMLEVTYVFIIIEVTYMYAFFTTDRNQIEEKYWRWQQKYNNIQCSWTHFFNIFAQKSTLWVGNFQRRTVLCFAFCDLRKTHVLKEQDGCLGAFRWKCKFLGYNELITETINIMNFIMPILLCNARSQHVTDLTVILCIQCFKKRDF